MSAGPGAVLGAVLGAVRKHAVVVVAGAMVVLGLLGWTMALTGGSSSPDNQALVDRVGTANVRSEVSRALTQVLSYDYTQPRVTRAAAEKYLTGQARKEYDTLFRAMQKKAPGQHLVLSATIRSVGVKRLTDDTAELLVFLDQASRRAKDKENSISAAQLKISARKVHGNWKITTLTPL